MTIDLESDLELAIELAREAGEVALRTFRSPSLEVSVKSDGSPVSRADLDAEKLLRRHLAQARPDDGVLGEEYGEKSATHGRRWVLDPIDGTKAYIRGVPLFSTLVSLIDYSGIRVGVIHLPALQETVWAARGCGAYLNGEPATVSTRRGLNGSFVMTSGVNHWPPSALSRVLRTPGLTCRTWGDGYGYAMVATGRAEAMVDFGACEWDLAAPSLIVREAGGQFTDLAGVSRHTGEAGVATNGEIHQRLLQLLR